MMKRVVGLSCVVVLLAGVAGVSPVAAVSSRGSTLEAVQLSAPVGEPVVVDPSWRPPVGSQRLALPTGVAQASRVGGPEPVAVRDRFGFEGAKRFEGRSPADLPVNDAVAPDAGVVAGWSRPSGSLPAPMTRQPSGIVGSVYWLPGPGFTPRVTAASPPARTLPGGVFDVARNVDLVFGGRNSSGSALADTWTFDGYAWTQLSPATSPPARSAGLMVYDQANSQVVLFGGLGSAGTVLSDTWVWNGTTWTQKFPATVPTARKAPAGTYNASLGAVMMFGGYSASVALGDTWKWTGSNWVSVSTTGAPPVRGEAAMAYDASTSKVVLFGGSTFTGTLLDDTWTLSATTWTQESPAGHPDARRSHAMVYSSEFGGVQLFGGQGRLELFW